jgi:hypothetical protein
MHCLSFKNICKIFFFFIFLQCIAFGQLKKLEKPNMVCQSDIYLDQIGNKYSKLITISFNKHAIDVENGAKIISIDDVQSSDI